jgi:hypothetical protein
MQIKAMERELATAVERIELFACKEADVYLELADVKKSLEEANRSLSSVSSTAKVKEAEVFALQTELETAKCNLMERYFSSTAIDESYRSSQLLSRSRSCISAPRQYAAVYRREMVSMSAIGAQQLYEIEAKRSSSLMVYDSLQVSSLKNECEMTEQAARK